MPVLYNAPLAFLGSDPFPLVIFSPGAAANRNTYSSVCTEVASRGCVVVAVEHADGSSVGGRCARVPVCVCVCVRACVLACVCVWAREWVCDGMHFSDGYVLPGMCSGYLGALLVHAASSGQHEQHQLRFCELKAFVAPR
jgi:hypothetical protein